MRDEPGIEAYIDATSEARAFDMIVLGGETFGSVLASHLFNRDVTHAHRILVLEAGPMVFYGACPESADADH